MIPLTFWTSAALFGPPLGKSTVAASIEAGSTGVAVAVDVFVCVIAKSSPGLPTRIETLTLWGSTCVEVASGSAVGSVP
jgi:hypothetical protein